MGGLSRAHLRRKVEAVVARGPVECSPVRTPTRSGDSTKPPGSQQPFNQPGPKKAKLPEEKGLWSWKQYGTPNNQEARLIGLFLFLLWRGDW